MWCLGNQINLNMIGSSLIINSYAHRVNNLQYPHPFGAPSPIQLHFSGCESFYEAEVMSRASVTPSLIDA